MSMCEDCPPVGYPTDKTRCEPCPRRDRPAKNPGGCECMECGCIFIGEEWDGLCAVCESRLRATTSGN